MQIILPSAILSRNLLGFMKDPECCFKQIAAEFFKSSNLSGLQFPTKLMDDVSYDENFVVNSDASVCQPIVRGLSICRWKCYSNGMGNKLLIMINTKE